MLRADNQLFLDLKINDMPAKTFYKYCFIITFAFLCFKANAQKFTYTAIDAGPFGDASRHWYGIIDKGNIIQPKPNQQRYKPTDVVAVADNILLYQKNNGGWPKNYDMFAILTPDQIDSLQKAKNETNTTFDNATTWTHVDCLAKVYTSTKIEKYKTACIKGINFILAAQYANGGWPQYFPLEKNNYSTHITYNDGAMIGIMGVLDDILNRKPYYLFLDELTEQQHKKIEAAFENGLNCIFKTQIVDNGVLTAWCQQHDEVTLLPAWARAFEPPSICGDESADIVLFLMGIKNPSKQIITAINAAVEWMKKSKILYTKVVRIDAPAMVTKFRVSKSDRVVVIDSAAPPIWTRYYELKTNRPLFCNRDSKVVYSLAEVDRERRDGYGWYTYAPQKVLDEYPAWKAKLK